MQAGFTGSGTDVILDFFQSTTTQTFPFSEFERKWHFLGAYREGAIGGYAYDGVEKQSSNSLALSGAATSLHIGGEDGGTNPFLGVISRFSIYERESAG